MTAAPAGQLCQGNAALRFLAFPAPHRMIRIEHITVEPDVRPIAAYFFPHQNSLMSPLCGVT